MQASPLPSDDSATTDAVIAERIAAGDKDALRALIRKYNQRLYRTARAILADDAEAEDAVQEAYLTAYRSMGGFRGEARLSTWLIRIVANEAITRQRKRARRAAVIPLDAGSAESISARDLVESPSHEEPEQQAMRAESRRVLEAKIDALPEAYRAVFMLRAVEEMSVEETAVALDIPQATVRTRYFRARSLLRESISREFDMATENAFAFAGARCDRMLANVLEGVAREAALPGNNPLNPKDTT
jgi:RNA polymerase sigma-70 factor (ECF subfamily)